MTVGMCFTSVSIAYPNSVSWNIGMIKINTSDAGSRRMWMNSL
jgi:hypothetical protein